MIINYSSGTAQETTSAVNINKAWNSITSRPFTILDTTSFSPTATQIECEVIMYPRPAGANTLLSGRFWADKPLKFTVGSTTGGVISTYLPPYLSLNINTDTLEIDANGKLNIKAGSSQWTTSETKIYYNAGFIGMNTTNPIYRLDVIDDSTHIAAFRHTNLTQGIGIGFDRLVAMGSNQSQNIVIAGKGPYGGVNFDTNGANRVRIDGNGLVSCENINYNTINARGNAWIYSANESTGIGLYFGTPFTGVRTCASKSAIIAEPITNHSRHNLCFCLNNANNNSINATVSDAYFKLHSEDYTQILRAFEHPQSSGFGFRKTFTGTAFNQINFNANGLNYQRTHKSGWAITHN